MDGHGRAAVPGCVVDPGLDVTVIRLACSASFVERIRDAIASDDAIGRAGERVVFLGPAGSIDAYEAESLGVVARIGVLDVEVHQYALGVCSEAGYLWHQRTGRRVP